MKGQKLHDKVSITAFGAVTPLGSNYSDIAKSLKEGRSGIKKIDKFNCATFITQHAGVPNEGNELVRWPSSRPRFAERVYADLAATNLYQHPQFPKTDYQKQRLGCIIGVDEPAVDVQLCLKMKAEGRQGDPTADLLDKMIRYFKLNDCLNLEPSSVLSTIHKKIPFSGFSLSHMGLCSASLQAIGMGMQALQTNLLDAVIVGGVSGKVNPINLARLELMGVISTDTNFSPEQRSRPFDKRRSGFVLAEGAILFLLEKEKNVLARRDQPLLNILGYGSSLGAEHIIAPHTQSLEMKLAMQRALENAQIVPERIELINVHGTSTVLNDIHESEAISSIFSTNPNCNVTANKSLHGHLIAAAGAMEVLNTLISCQEGFIPGSINCQEQDEKCSINLLKERKIARPSLILKNSFGMGGLAASIVLENSIRKCSN